MTEPLHILAVLPHPDDTAFFAAGTLARWVVEGHHVTSVCVTGGDVGTLRRDQTPEQVAAAREKELRAANAVLGIPETLTLGYPDGGFIDPDALRQELVHLVRKLRPDRLLTLDPWLRYEIHPDHGLVGRLACDAAAFGAFPLLFPDQIQGSVQPHSPSEVWLMGLLGRRPNVYVDIASTIDVKVASARQFAGTPAILAGMFAPQIDPADVSPDEHAALADSADTWLRSMAARMGRAVNLGAAEAFFIERCLPGHFHNVDRLIGEMLGEEDPPPTIL